MICFNEFCLRFISQTQTRLRALTAEESWVLFNFKILPDLCSRWSSVKGIAGNGENLHKFQVLTSQATCFSEARCTS